MTDFLDELGLQLVQAANAHHSAAHSRSPSGRRAAPLRVLVIVAVLSLVIAAAALAATGVLGTGAPVHPGAGSSRTVGIGIPARGESQLLRLRVADPDGGLPWGMRIVHTTRGLVCVQIGRVYHGQLGLLGIDGAFGDDGLFHPLPPNALAQFPGSGSAVAAGAQNCSAPGVPFSQSASGLSASAAVSHGPVAAAAQRWVSYGLLGAHARQVSYTQADRIVSEPVARGTGAYLIVLDGHQPGTHGEQTSGSASSAATIQPAGALTAITYQFGHHICQTGVVHHATSTCPTARASRSPTNPVPGRGHRAIDVSIVPAARGHDTAIVTFIAPYRVTNAMRSYQIAIPSPCHQGTIIIPVNHNIAAGHRVRARISDVFANACSNRVVIRVLYGPTTLPTAQPTPTITIGQATISRPRHHR